MNRFKKLLGTAALAVLTAAGAAQAADVSFMSFTYAEEANTKTVQALLDGFQTADKLSVEPLGYAWGDMQKNIFLRAKSNTLPDIAQLSERWLPTFASLDTLVDLNTVYGKDKLEASFAPDALAMGQIGGKQLALPLLSGTIGMVANKAVLEQAGVAKAPETIDEFKAALVAVRDKVPNSVPYSMATKNNGSILIDFMLWNWAHGGRIIDDEGKVVVDSDASRAALQFMVDLVKERLAAPEIDRPDSRRLMAQGASAFYFDAPQTRTFLREFSGKGEAFDANVLPMTTPVLKAGEKPVSVQWGHLLVQFAPEAKASADAPADKFLTYLTSDTVQTDFPLKMSAPRFNGIQNFVTIASSPEILAAFLTTAIYVVFATAGTLVMGLGWALIMNQPFRGRGVLRSLSLLPWVLPSTVSAFIWAWIFNSRYGVLNAFLLEFGFIDFPQAWLSTPQGAMFAVILTKIWLSIPLFMSFFLAGLQNLDREQIDAARVDGAGNWVILRDHILPHLRPVLIIVVVLGVIGNLQQFDTIYALTGGGPVRATTVLSVEVYKRAFEQWDIGLASAIGVLWVATLLPPAFLYLRMLVKGN